MLTLSKFGFIWSYGAKTRINKLKKRSAPNETDIETTNLGLAEWNKSRNSQKGEQRKRTEYWEFEYQKYSKLRNKWQGGELLLCKWFSISTPSRRPFKRDLFCPLSQVLSSFLYSQYRPIRDFGVLKIQLASLPLVRRLSSLPQYSALLSFDYIAATKYLSLLLAKPASTTRSRLRAVFRTRHRK